MVARVLIRSEFVKNFPSFGQVMCLSLVGVLCLASGCSSTRRTPGNAVAVASVRAPIPGTKTVPMKLSKKQYIEALGQGGGIDTARIVEIFHREHFERNLPEYRFFEVQRGSVYTLLGLQTADVLVAANGFVVPSAGRFKQYLLLMQQLEDASIEVRRGGRHLVFQYEFIDDVPKGPLS